MLLIASICLCGQEIARDGRFIAYNNGTVKDTSTGLMWASKDNGSDIDWQGAKKYCENYRGGGYTDWRMPTVAELAGLYDKNKTGYKMECPMGSDPDRPLYIYTTRLIHLSCCCPWASERRGHLAAFFVFNSGRRNRFLHSYFYARRALPVRAGK
jgi:hypothetical protein